MNQLTLNNSERYCVFRSGDHWYGIPALAVRNVIPRPELTPTPHSDPILKGICHSQNEFLPVVSLQALTEIQYDTAPQAEQQLLVLLGPQGPWGLLIDQAEALADLEISISTFQESQDQSARTTLGSATYENQVLQVLDPKAIYDYAASLIDGYWQNVDEAQLKSAV